MIATHSWQSANIPTKVVNAIVSCGEGGPQSGTAAPWQCQPASFAEPHW